MLDYGRRFNSRSDYDASSKVAIARLVTGDIEGALVALQADRRSDNPVMTAIQDAQQADLLQLIGRGAEAQAKAAHALAVVSAAIAEGRPAIRGQEAAWYARAAAIAALAGDRDKAAAWQRKASAAPVATIDERVALALPAALRRFLGDPEAAWRSKAKTIDAFLGTDRGELLAFKPYYDKLYAQSPSYRAYMSKLAAQP